MAVRIKVCCIASWAEAKMAISAGADTLGLVARMPSGPGPISDPEIFAITQKLLKSIDAFLLTSEIRADSIAAHIDATKPTTVQIVHHIDPDECRKLSSLRPSTRIVQVIHVEDMSALAMIDQYHPHIDAFLLDSGRPNAKIAELGGTGRTHNWDISQAFVKASPLPVYLAGGLNSDNVQKAIEYVKPYGVDLCSGVRSDGKLDGEKLERFVAAVKAAKF